jgi:hypothetical protein
LSNSFEVIHRMRLVPCSLRDMFLLFVATVIPMLPLLLIIVPLSDLIVRAVKMIVGIE